MPFAVSWQRRTWFASSLCSASAAALITAPGMGAPIAHTPPAPHPAALTARMSRMPMSFEVNTGRFDPRVRFVSHSGGSTLFLTDTGATMVLPGKPITGSAKAGRDRKPVQRGPGHVLRMRLVGSRKPTTVTGLQRLPGYTNYLIGEERSKWRTRVPQYQQARFQGVYPGTDLVYYGNSGRIEYDFIVKPGADPGRVRLAFDGVTGLRVAANGDLVAGTSVGDVMLKRPYAYQMVCGQRVQVACGYSLAPGSRQVSLRTARYDPSRPLVVDPTLVAGTLVGGTVYDDLFGVAIAADGSIGLTGATASPDFPTTAGAFQTALSSYDAFVTVLSADCKSLVFSTYVGSGSDASAGGALIPVPDGWYVAGYAGPGFPVTSGAFQTSHAGGGDTFVLKLNGAGTALVASTYLGGDYGETFMPSLAVDSSGRPVVASTTYSLNFPVTPGAYQTTNAGGSEAFVARLSSDLATLEASTLLGGALDDEGTAVAVDPDGTIAVSGVAGSHDFPTTVGAYQTQQPAEMAGFVTRFASDLSSLVASTVIHGDDTSGVKLLDMAITPDGSIATCGHLSNGGGYPTTPGAVQPQSNGGYEGVVSVFSRDLTALLASTYLGGSSGDEIYSIAVDGSSGFWVAGTTWSSNWPVTPDAYQPVAGGSGDAVLGHLTAALTAVDYGTYLGGSSTEELSALAVSPDGSLVVGARVQGEGWPVTPGALRSAMAGSQAGAVARFTTKRGSALAVSNGSGEIGSAVTLSATLTSGASALSGKSVSFTVGGAPVGSDTTDASGVASVSYTIAAGTSAGDKAIGASFAGDAGYKASTGTGTLTVKQTTTALVAGDSSGAPGQSASLTATLTANGVGLPGKTVSFTVAGSAAGSGTTNANGVATISYTVPGNTLVGNKVIVASFAGDTDYKPSTGSGTLSVDTIATTLAAAAPDDLSEGAYETVSATLTRTTGGTAISGKTISFSLGGTAIGTATTDAAGKATLEFLVPDTLAEGSIALDASFAGTSAYASAGGSAQTAIVGGRTSGYAAPATGKRGDRVKLYCYLYRTIAPRDMLVGKAITITVDGAQVGSGTTDRNGYVAVNWTIPGSITPGAHELAYTYEGDSYYTGWTGVKTLTVTGRADLFAGSMPDGSPGSTVALYAYLYDRVSGEAYAGQELSFLVDGVAVGAGTTDAQGKATVSYTVPAGMSLGNHVITVNFAGNAGYPAATATGTLVVLQKAVTMMYVRSYPLAVAGQKLKLYCYLYQKQGKVMLAGKTVTINVDGVDVATPATDANGYAQYLYTVPSGSATHVVTISFAGDAENKPISGTGAVIVP